MAIMNLPLLNTLCTRLLNRWHGLALVGMLTSCSSLPETTHVPATAADSENPVVVNSVERTLLEMPFEEAKAISPQTAKVGNLFQVAADKVEVLKTDRDGHPVKVRATGHVFVDMALSERATGLCEEATLTVSDVTLRGKPIVKRGDRVAKATENSASFWITETRLKVTGKCELTRLEPDLLSSSLMVASNDFFPVPEPVLPPMTQAWNGAAMNGLLPALTATGQ